MKKIGLLCLALVLALGAMGGAIAYFWNAADLATTMSAGTIDLQIKQAPEQTCGEFSSDCSDCGSGSWEQGGTWTVGLDFAPGDTVRKCVCLKNAGTTGGLMLRIGIVALNDPDNISPEIDVTSICYSEDNRTKCSGNIAQYYPTQFDTLWSMYNTGYSFAFTKGVEDPPVHDYLAFGSANVEKVCLDFTFNKDAGIEFMGKTCTFTIKYVLTDDPTWTKIGDIGSSAGYVED